MDLKKIGAFIAYNRKANGLTQQQLADKLGVSNKTVSRWETGKYMMDLSLLQPICEELDITLNELLSGERIETQDLEKQAETNLINTITYSKQEIKNEQQRSTIIIMVIGVLISISAFILFNPESSWGSIYSIIGIILFTAGLFRKLKIKKVKKKILCCSLVFIIILTMFNIIDYVGVITYQRPPIYRYKVTTNLQENKIITYHSSFYDVYRINADSINEYYIVDTNKKYANTTIPISPFNRQKSGIDNLVNYQHQYLANNSNTGNLLADLPLNEYGFAFELDSKNLGIIINYYTTDWYHNDNLYINKSLIYNSVAIFLLIDNVEYLKYNFSGNSYYITRKDVEANYPNYEKIKADKVNKKMFNQYLEAKMNDQDFVEKQFKILFSNSAKNN